MTDDHNCVVVIGKNSGKIHIFIIMEIHLFLEKLCNKTLNLLDTYL